MPVVCHRTLQWVKPQVGLSSGIVQVSRQASP